MFDTHTSKKLFGAKFPVYTGSCEKRRESFSYDAPPTEPPDQINDNNYVR